MLRPLRLLAACVLVAAAAAACSFPPAEPGAPGLVTVDNRVARFDLDFGAAPMAAISNWTPIITGLPHAGNHNGCRVRFQPGTDALFVSTGDAATATAPQSTSVLGGKILRVDMNGAPWP